MSLPQLLSRPCTIIRRTSSDDEDELGNEIPDEESVTTVCELQQRQRDEDDVSEVSDTHWLLVLGPDEAIDSGDSVVVDGNTYEVVGEPWHARNPRTRTVEHVEATVRRTSRPADEAGS